MQALIMPNVHKQNVPGSNTFEVIQAFCQDIFSTQQRAEAPISTDRCPISKILKPSNWPGEWEEFQTKLRKLEEFANIRSGCLDVGGATS